MTESILFSWREFAPLISIKIQVTIKSYVKAFENLLYLFEAYAVNLFQSTVDCNINFAEASL